MHNVLGREDGYPGALRAFDGFPQFVGFDVHAQNFAPVLHKGRHVQGLSSCAGTAVQNAVTGLRVHIGGNALASSVLHFIPAFLK
jgi:hypothetical protein